MADRRCGARRKEYRNAPREGTNLRQVYDLFMLRPTTPIARTEIAKNGRVDQRVFDDLTDYYGLDIRQYKRGFWWLVGITDARGRYHDFIAHRVPA